MKISNSYLFDRATQNIQSAQSDISKSRERIASGKSLVRPSDDTGKLRSIEILKSHQRKTESYDSSMNHLKDRFQLEESVLSSASDILIRLKDLAIQSANDSLGASDRDIIATEVDSLRDELLAIANTRDVEGNYIFSGSKSDTQPFLKDDLSGLVAYQGDNRQLYTSVSETRILESNTDGTEIFSPVNRTSSTYSLTGLDAGGSYNFRVGDAVIEFTVDSPLTASEIESSVSSALANSSISSSVTVELVNGRPSIQLVLTGGSQRVLQGTEVTQSDGNTEPLGVTFDNSVSDGVDFFKMLNDFHEALTSNTRSDIDRAISELSTAQDSIAHSIGRVGSRLNTIDRQQEINADLRLRVDQMLSNEEDLDYAKAVTQFNAELVRLEATQASFAKVAQLSLFQFI